MNNTIKKQENNNLILQHNNYGEWKDSKNNNAYSESENFYSIVIPTMWFSDKISVMLPIYEKSEFVKEVIIIDNRPSKKIDLSQYSKIRYYTKGENIFVNPAWNWGYSLSNYKLILANDDIIIEDFDLMMKMISESDFDIIGVSLEIKNDIPKIKRLFDEKFPANSFGCFMYIKNYIYIPEQLKIWYGDNIQFKYNKKRGILKNIKIETNQSETLNNKENIENLRKNIAYKDTIFYKEIKNINIEKINILIRTSGRPNYFKKCIESIRNYYPYAKLHITIDNFNDLKYIKENVFDFEYNYYLLNKETIENICKKISIERNLFIYNWYFNVIRPFLNGWCFILDDDDELLMTPKFNKDNIENIYLYKVNIIKKVVPSNENFKKFPVLNDISGIGIIFHSSKMINWLPQRGGDYSFISTLYKTSNPVWIDEILSKTQTGGNIGKRNDLEIIDINEKKKISVNIATYPNRKKSFIKCISNLLKIDIIDIIRVYLNEYTKIPNDFPFNDKIEYLIGKTDLKDSGKFFWSNDLKNEYYFTLDDDLIYSEYFFEEHIKLLQEYKNEIFVTLHGKEMVEKPLLFNDCKKSFHCLRNVDENSWVNNPGTGVMLFDNSKFSIPINWFKYHGMADLYIALYCQKNKIPIICRKHEKNELYYLKDLINETLFDKRNILNKKHQKILEQIETWKLYKKIKFNSNEYWENRHKSKMNSGNGSYGILAEYKANIINEFIEKNNIKNIIDFGCGDGNQLSKYICKNYIGLDISKTIIKQCKEKFKNDYSKEFYLIDEYKDKKSELCLSIDVVYHLVEDEVFKKYMKNLFNSSDKFVIIYSSNGDLNYNFSEHIRDRNFTDWIEQNIPEFKLINKIENKYKFKSDLDDSKNTSISDFYFYKKSEINYLRNH